MPTGRRPFVLEIAVYLARDWHSKAFSLTGKVALVTGASRGLGCAIAEALASAGALVFVNGRQADAVAKVVAGIRARNGKAESLVFDVNSDALRHEALSTIRSRGIGLHILVNNVGVRLRRTAEEIEADSFCQLLAGNLVAPFALAKLAAPLMQEANFGRIINVSSLSASLARPGDAAYIASKGGVEALTRALACEFAKAGINCNAIAPGTFATESNHAMSSNSSFDAYVRGRVPLARWGTPDEIAGAALFLASPASSFINGQVIAVDGGLSVAM